MAMTQLFNATHFSEFQPQATTVSAGQEMNNRSGNNNNENFTNSTKLELQASRSTSPSSGAEDCSTASSLCTSSSSSASTSTGCRTRSGSLTNQQEPTNTAPGSIFSTKPPKLPTMNEEKTEEQQQPMPPPSQIPSRQPDSLSSSSQNSSPPSAISLPASASILPDNNINAAPFIPNNQLQQKSSFPGHSQSGPHHHHAGQHHHNNSYNNNNNNSQFESPQFRSNNFGSLANNNFSFDGQQQQQQQQQPHPKRDSSQNNLYKTELCRSFIETGQCRYGSKCQFAHGHEELRNLTRHPKYKTEMCRSFHTTGICPYGSRCHFVHTQPPACMQNQANGPGAQRSSPMSIAGHSDNNSDRSNGPTPTNQPPTRVSPFGNSGNSNNNAWSNSGMSMAQKIRNTQSGAHVAGPPGNNCRRNGSSGFFGSLGRDNSNSNSMPGYMQKNDPEQVFQAQQQSNGTSFNNHNWSNVVRDGSKRDTAGFGQNFEVSSGNSFNGGSSHKVKFDMGWPSNDDENARNGGGSNGGNFMSSLNEHNNPPSSHREADWNLPKTSSIFGATDSLFSTQSSFGHTSSSKTSTTTGTTTPWSTNIDQQYDRSSSSSRTRTSESFSIFDSKSNTNAQPEPIESYNPNSFLENMFNNMTFNEKVDNKTIAPRTEQQPRLATQQQQPQETSLFQQQPTNSLASLFMSSNDSFNLSSSKPTKSRLPCFQELTDSSV